MFSKVLVVVLLAAFASAQPPRPSALRIAHASPNAPHYDVYINGTKLFFNLGYRQVTYYVPDFVPNAVLHIQVTPAGSLSPIVLESNFSPAQGTPYTFAIENLVNNIRGQYIIDDQTRPAPGHSLFRFVHLSPDAPRVDVAIVGGSTLFKNVDFTQASNYTSIPAGHYHLQVLNSATRAVLLDLTDIEVPPLAISFFGEGLVADKSFTAVLAVDI